MTERIVGWIVRTHDGVKERHWLVGLSNLDQAEEVAATLAHAGAQGVSPITEQRGRAVFQIKAGRASEILVSKTKRRAA